MQRCKESGYLDRQKRGWIGRSADLKDADLLALLVENVDLAGGKIDVAGRVGDSTSPATVREGLCR